MSVDQGTCRSCGAQILWVVTGKGKRAPLDPVWHVVTDEEGHSYRGHMNHFATCPSADQHRRAK